MTENLIEKLKAYNFRDELNHPLTNCVEFKELANQSLIMRELIKTLIILGAKSDLLAIIGSVGDTLSDSEVLKQLQAWNSNKSCVPNKKVL